MFCLDLHPDTTDLCIPVRAAFIQMLLLRHIVYVDNYSRRDTRDGNISNQDFGLRNTLLMQNLSDSYTTYQLAKELIQKMKV
jgi:hypothetical protein